jgi:hypothetical protein
MDVDHVAQHVSDLIDETDVSADGHVAVMRGRRRQLARQIRRQAVLALPQVAVHGTPWRETAFLFGRQPILGPQSPRRMIAMLLVPIVGHLSVVIVELRMVLAVSLLASGSLLLSEDRRSGHQPDSNHANDGGPDGRRRSSSLRHVAHLLRYSPARPSTSSGRSSGGERGILRTLERALAAVHVSRTRPETATRPYLAIADVLPGVHLSILIRHRSARLATIFAPQLVHGGALNWRLSSATNLRR